MWPVCFPYVCRQLLQRTEFRQHTMVSIEILSVPLVCSRLAPCGNLAWCDCTVAQLLPSSKIQAGVGVAQLPH
jgi:hypothetical protein